MVDTNWDKYSKRFSVGARVVVAMVGTGLDVGSSVGLTLSLGMLEIVGAGNVGIAVGSTIKVGDGVIPVGASVVGTSVVGAAVVFVVGALDPS